MKVDRDAILIELQTIILWKGIGNIKVFIKKGNSDIRNDDIPGQTICAE